MAIASRATISRTSSTEPTLSPTPIRTSDIPVMQLAFVVSFAKRTRSCLRWCSLVSPRALIISVRMKGSYRSIKPLRLFRGLGRSSRLIPVHLKCCAMASRLGAAPQAWRLRGARCGVVFVQVLAHPRGDTGPPDNGPRRGLRGWSRRMADGGPAPVDYPEGSPSARLPFATTIKSSFAKGR